MGFNIHDLFFFSPDFESIGKWYRQLIGESIGKEYSKDNKQIFCGITGRNYRQVPRFVSN